MDWTIPAVVGVIALIVTIAGAYATWVIKVNTGERADSSATKAHGRIDTLAQMFSDHQQKSAKDLSDFKQEVARDYASNRMIEQMESRLVTAIERLGDRLDRAFEVRKP